MPDTQDVSPKLVPNVILHGPLLPEPIKVIAATPVGASYKIRCSHGRWWINRSALSKPPSGWFFRHRTVRTGHLTLT